MCIGGVYVRGCLEAGVYPKSIRNAPLIVLNIFKALIMILVGDVAIKYTCKAFDFIKSSSVLQQNQIQEQRLYIKLHVNHF